VEAPLRFDHRFAEGRLVQVDRRRWRLRDLPLGALDLRGGELRVGDPGAPEGWEALPVPPAEAALVAHLARDGRRELAAGATLRFGPAPVARWEAARPPEAPPAARGLHTVFYDEVLLLSPGVDAAPDPPAGPAGRAGAAAWLRGDFGLSWTAWWGWSEAGALVALGLDLGLLWAEDEPEIVLPIDPLHEGPLESPALLAAGLRARQLKPPLVGVSVSVELSGEDVARPSLTGPDGAPWAVEVHSEGGGAGPSVTTLTFLTRAVQAGPLELRFVAPDQRVPV
jgi:hypothetical protein